MTIKRINPCARWSDVTVYNGIAHFVEVPERSSADIRGQAQQVFAQAEEMLASVNSDKAKFYRARFI